MFLEMCNLTSDLITCTTQEDNKQPDCEKVTQNCLGGNGINKQFIPALFPVEQNYDHT